MYCNGNMHIFRNIIYGRTWQHLFSDSEKEAIAKTRKGNIISIENKHALCKFYQTNISKYSGRRIASKLIRDAMLNIGLDPDNDREYRVAKRLFYRYESPEITQLYKY